MLKFKRKEKQETGKGRSVFARIVAPLIALVLVEAILLSVVIIGSDLVGELDRTNESILDKQVESRANYLSTAFANWSDLQHLRESITTRAQWMIYNGAINLDKLDSDPDVCTPLLRGITDELVSTLYAKHLDGIYVVLNTQDISGIRNKEGIGERTGVYIRDPDPDAPPQPRNRDLLWERAPIQVVQASTFPTDRTWRPKFNYPAGEADVDRSSFVMPLRAIYSSTDRSNPEQYGYWGILDYDLLDSPYPAITYTVPLVLDNGKVFGVLGVSILSTHLQTMLPTDELFTAEGHGAYMLTVGPETADALSTFTPNLLTGNNYEAHDLDREIELEHYGDGYLYSSLDGTDHFLAAHSIPLYEAGSYFAGENWTLIGLAHTSALHSFSHKILLQLGLCVVLMLLVGFAASLVISRRLSRPIQKLSKEVEAVQLAAGQIPKLSLTGITEIDRFAGAITSLSQDIVTSSARFLQILHLASVELAGFEIRKRVNSLFVTDNFFAMLGLTDIPTEQLTVDDFWTLIRKLDSTPTAQHSSDGSALYQVSGENGEVRYIRIELTDLADSTIGIAEDTTTATLARLRAERERDYDLLTGLLSRRAFYARAGELFENPQHLGHAALLMLDLDNLKFFNDHYGHDCGDAYIRKAGECFLNSAPKNSLCSRVSGDEFFLLFYGYPDTVSLQEELDRFVRTIRENSFHPGGGDPVPVSASGGVARYPEDATELKMLMKYADFAMYQVKRTSKGDVGTFDLAAYNRESFLDKSRQEFMQLLREEKIFFHFQPIVDAHSGKIFAYEALMRTDLPTLHSPDAILAIARETGHMQDIESLTWVRAYHYFRLFLATGKAEQDAYLFVNSIASEHMDARAQERFRNEVGDLQSRIVVEITEVEDMTYEAIQAKRNTPGCAGLFALDDYGSGYSNEKALLELAPQFVKVDRSIIRDIDQDPDKQKIVTNLVSYSHERGIKVVAEGVETTSELMTVLELGADLLQGYLLSRPGIIPDPVPPAVLERIQAFNKQAAKQAAKQAKRNKKDKG